MARIATFNLADWQARMGYTQLQAARALGIGISTYKRHLVGKPTVMMVLACKWLEHTKVQQSR